MAERGNTLKELTNGYAYNQLKQVATLLTEIGSLNNGLGKDFGLSAQLLTANKAAIELKTNLAEAYNSRTGNLDLNAFNKQLMISGKNISQIGQELGAIGVAGNRAFGELTRSIMVAEKPLIGMSKVATSLWNTLGNTVKWQASSLAVQSVMKQVASATSYVKQLDSSLNNIQIVTNQSSAKMAEFAKQANRAAKELNSTTNEYAKASLIYYQQGLDNKSVLERANTTIKLANVTGQSAKVVSDQLTAVWNNFYNGSKNLEYYADAMAALGATTASSSSEIAKGLSKFASIANSTGLSFEYASSALATVVANTRQSADAVGTSFRTLFSRLQGLSLGETLDDGTTLNKYSKALLSVGVNIKQANGELKNMDTILSEIGNKWQNLAQDQKVALAQTVGGARNYTGLMSLMDNWDDFTHNLKTAQDAQGTLQKQADVYAKSWEAASAHVRAASETLYSNLLNDSFMKGATNFVGTFLDQLGHVTTNLNGFRGSLLALGSIGSRIFADKLPSAMGGLAYNLKSLTPSGRAAIEQLRQDAQTELMRHTNISQYSNANILFRQQAEQGKNVQASYNKAVQSGRIASYEAPIYQQLFSNLDKIQSEAITTVERAAAQNISNKLTDREIARNFIRGAVRTQADFDAQDQSIQDQRQKEKEAKEKADVLDAQRSLDSYTTGEYNGAIAYAESFNTQGMANRRREATNLVRKREQELHEAELGARQLEYAQRNYDYHVQRIQNAGIDINDPYARAELAPYEQQLAEARSGHEANLERVRQARVALQEAQEASSRVHSTDDAINGRAEAMDRVVRAEAGLASRQASLRQAEETYRQTQGKPKWVENTQVYRDMVTNGFHYDASGNLVDRSGKQINRAILEGQLRDLEPFGGDNVREAQMFAMASDLQGNISSLRTGLSQGQNLKYLATRLGLDNFSLETGKEGSLESTAQQILQFTSENNKAFLDTVFANVENGDVLKQQLITYGQELRSKLDYSKGAAPMADQVRAILTGGTKDAQGNWIGGDEYAFSSFLEGLNLAGDQRINAAEDKRQQLLNLADRIASSDKAEGLAIAGAIREIVGTSAEAEAAEAIGVSDEGVTALLRLTEGKQGEKIPIGKVLASSVGAISNLGMTANSISGAIKVFGDEAASTGEKLGAIGTVAASGFSTFKYFQSNLQDFTKQVEKGKGLFGSSYQLTGLGKGNLLLTAGLALGAVAFQTGKTIYQNYSLNGRIQTAQNEYAAQQQIIANKKNDYEQLEVITEEYNKQVTELRNSLQGSSDYFRTQATINTTVGNLIEQYGLEYGKDYTIRDGTMLVDAATQQRITEQAEKEYLNAVNQGNILQAKNTFLSAQQVAERESKKATAEARNTGHILFDENGYPIADDTYVQQQLNENSVYQAALAKQKSAARNIAELSLSNLANENNIQINDFIKSAFLNNNNLENIVDEVLKEVEQGTLDGFWNNLASTFSGHGSTSIKSIEALKGLNNEEIWDVLATQGLVSGEKPEKAELKTVLSGVLPQYILQEYLQSFIQDENLQNISDYFANYMQFTSSQLSNAINTYLIGDQAYNAAIQSLTQQTANIQSGLLAALSNNLETEWLTGNDLINSEQFQNLIQNYSLNQLQDITDYIITSGTVFGSKTAQTIFDNLSSGQNTKVLQQLSKVNWDNTFTALGDINRLARNLGEYDNIYGDILNTAIDSLGAEGGIFEQLYNSSGFSKVLDSLTAQFDTMGEITTGYVVKLAQKNEELNTVLSLGASGYSGLNINAAGLASAFTLLNSGRIQRDQITSGVISALSTTHQLEAEKYKAFDVVDNQDLGRSGTDLLDYFSNAQKAYINAKSQDLTYDTPLQNIFRTLMPTYVRDAYIAANQEGNGLSFTQIMDSDKIPESVKEFLGHTNKKGTKPVTTWSEVLDLYSGFIKESTLSAEDAWIALGFDPNNLNLREDQKAYFDKHGVSLETIANAMLGIDFSNGNLWLNDTTGENRYQYNTKQTIDNIAKIFATMMPEEQAKNLAQIFTAHVGESSGGTILQENDARTAIEDLKKQESTAGGKRMYSQAALDALWWENSYFYNQMYEGTTEEERKAAFIKDITNGNGVIAPSLAEDFWQDNKGNGLINGIGEAYFKANGWNFSNADSAFNKLLRDFGVTDSRSAQSKIDFNKLQELVSFLGGTDEDLKNLIDNNSEFFNGRTSVSFIDKFGLEHTVEKGANQSTQEYLDKINAEQNQANNDTWEYKDATGNSHQIYDPLGLYRRNYNYNEETGEVTWGHENENGEWVEGPDPDKVPVNIAVDTNGNVYGVSQTGKVLVQDKQGNWTIRGTETTSTPSGETGTETTPTQGETGAETTPTSGETGAETTPTQGEVNEVDHAAINAAEAAGQITTAQAAAIRQGAMTLEQAINGTSKTTTIDNNEVTEQTAAEQAAKEEADRLAAEQAAAEQAKAQEEQNAAMAAYEAEQEEAARQAAEKAVQAYQDEQDALLTASNENIEDWIDADETGDRRRQYNSMAAWSNPAGFKDWYDKHFETQIQEPETQIDQNEVNTQAQAITQAMQQSAFANFGANIATNQLYDVSGISGYNIADITTEELDTLKRLQANADAYANMGDKGLRDSGLTRAEANQYRDNSQETADFYKYQNMMSPEARLAEINKALEIFDKGEGADKLTPFQKFLMNSIGEIVDYQGIMADGFEEDEEGNQKSKYRVDEKTGEIVDEEGNPIEFDSNGNPVSSSSGSGTSTEDTGTGNRPSSGSGDSGLGPGAAPGSHVDDPDGKGGIFRGSDGKDYRFIYHDGNPIASLDGNGDPIPADTENNKFANLAGNVASGQNNARFLAYASGKEGHIAVTGELGPELRIKSDGSMDVLGKKGREYAWVEPDDRIYTASQSAGILKSNKIPGLEGLAKGINNFLPGYAVGEHVGGTDHTSSGGGGGGGGGGGRSRGGSGAAEELDPRYDPNTLKIRDVLERYYTILQKIDDITRAVEKFAKVADRAWGQDRIKAIEKQTDLYQKQYDAQKQYVQQIGEYMNTDKNALTTMIREFVEGWNTAVDENQDPNNTMEKISWTGAAFDSNGVLTNYRDFVEKLVEQYNSNAQANSMDKNVQYKFQEQLKDIQMYTDTLNLWESETDKLQELANQILDNSLKEITYRVEYELELNADQKRLLDFHDSFVKDDIFRVAEHISNMNDEIANTADSLEKTRKGLYDYLGTLAGENMRLGETYDDVALGIAIRDEQGLVSEKNYKDIDFKAVSNNLDKWLVELRQKDSESAKKVDEIIQRDANGIITNYRDVLNKINEMNEQLSNSSINLLLSDAQTFFNQISDLTNNPKWTGLSTEMKDQITNYMDQFIQYIQSMGEEFKDIIESMGDSIKAFGKKMDAEIDEFDYYGDVYKSFGNIIDLTNQKMTDITSDFFKTLNSKVLDNNINKIEAARRRYELFTNTLAQVQAQYNAMVDRMNAAQGAEEHAFYQQRVDELKEQLDIANSQMENAHKEFLQSWEDALSKIQENYKDAVEQASKEFEKGFSPLFNTLALLQAQFDREKALGDLYVDNYQRIHDLNKLNRDIDQSIIDTDNLKSKGRLRDLQKEINDLQEDGTELSEYDLDILDKKYKLELARQALEDARDAKSIVRLSRDNNGNWGYVYTADEDEIAEAEQNYEDAIRDMEQANQDYIDNIQDQIINVQQQAQQAIIALQPEDFATYDEYLAAIQNIQDSMYQTLNYLRSQMNNAFDNNDWLENYVPGIVKDHNLTDDFDNTILADLLLNGNLDNVIENAKDNLENNLINPAIEAFTTYSEKQKEVYEVAGHNMATIGQEFGKEMETLTKQSEEQVNVVMKLADRVEDSFGDTMDAVIQATNDWLDKIKDVVKEYDILLEKITELKKIDGEYVEPAKLINGDNAVDTWEELERFQNELISNGILNLVTTDATTGKEKVTKYIAGTQMTNDFIHQATIGAAKRDIIDLGENTDPFMSQYTDIVDDAEDARVREYLNAHGVVWVKYVDTEGEHEEMFSSIEEWEAWREKHKPVAVWVEESGGGETPWTVGGFSQNWLDANWSGGYLDTGGYTGRWQSADTGMYTGEWSNGSVRRNGRLALLHQKELVLNAHDTENFLDAMEIVRQLDNLTNWMANGLGDLTIPRVTTESGELEQNVHIEAEFPNVTDHNEIEQAFSNLVNMASQYANRK